MSTQNQEQSLDVAKFLSPRVANLQADVWSIFSRISAKYQTINLGQGFMGFPAPDFVKQALSDAVMNDVNQYAPVRGLPRLCQALSKSYSPLFGRELDPNSEVLVTTGANEGIFCVFASFINQGDEAIFIEPYFDQYKPNLEMNGGIPVYCPLRLNPSRDFNCKLPSSAWSLDLKELESKISDKTKIIVLNTPYNPVGKMLSEEELFEIGNLAEKHDLIILSDEVYDRLYFEPAKHVRIATLSNFWKRTLTVGSAGKSFGVTGWRIGWVIGSSNLVKYVMGAHSRVCFCSPSTIQDAVASAFEQSQTNGFFDTQIQEYRERRDFFMKALDELKIPYVIPDGSYFILANTSNFAIPKNMLGECPAEIKARGESFQMCYWLAKHIGVTAIPCLEFYSNTEVPFADSLIRFAFCKPLSVLEQAVERLQKLREFLP